MKLASESGVGFLHHWLRPIRKAMQTISCAPPKTRVVFHVEVLACHIGARHANHPIP
jgi:hypothetical protein